MKKNLKWFVFIFAFLGIVGSAIYFYQQYEFENQLVSDYPKLRVMAYSSFLKDWGPGPELAIQFEKQNHVKIEWIEISNAGMIVDNFLSRKIEERPDLVLGLDLLTLRDAREKIQWRPLKNHHATFAPEIPQSAIYDDFLPLDWSPLTFIYKKTSEPPHTLNDLLSPQYANALGLQDPRTSSTGLYFLMWILSVKGEQEGFEYLGKLKSSIRIISPTWSASYSLFQNDQTPMVFSFFTSPLYHHLMEKDYRYQPIYFDDPHIYSVEYMGVPTTCNTCEKAEKFAHFLLTAKSQKVIMEKNFMLPVVEGVRKKTPFDFSRTISLIKPDSYERFLDKKDELIKRWSDLSL